MKTTKFLRFEIDTDYNAIVIKNKKLGDIWGYINYDTLLDKYIFQPESHYCIFSEECLDDINNVIKACNKAKRLTIE